MWNTLFAIAVGASVWFSAASLSVELNKQRAIFVAAVDKLHEASYRQASSNQTSEEQPPGLTFN